MPANAETLRTQAHLETHRRLLPYPDPVHTSKEVQLVAVPGYADTLAYGWIQPVADRIGISWRVDVEWPGIWDKADAGGGVATEASFCGAVSLAAAAVISHPGPSIIMGHSLGAWAAREAAAVTWPEHRPVAVVGICPAVGVFPGRDDQRTAQAWREVGYKTSTRPTVDGTGEISFRISSRFLTELDQHHPPTRPVTCELWVGGGEDTVITPDQLPHTGTRVIVGRVGHRFWEEGAESVNEIADAVAVHLGALLN